METVYSIDFLEDNSIEFLKDNNIEFINEEEEDNE